MGWFNSFWTDELMANRFNSLVQKQNDLLPSQQSDFYKNCGINLVQLAAAAFSKLSMDLQP